MIQEYTTTGNHITKILSVADLVQLAGVAAVEYCGGPSINFRIGRVDSHNESEIPKETTSEFDWNINQIKDKYYSLGFSDEEMVSLFGGRTLGFRDLTGKHKEQRWSRNPYVFDNNYFQELLDNNSPYIKTESDKAILQDLGLKKYIETFSKDENAFFEVYARSHEKLTEVGCKNLLSEETTCNVDESLALI
jgi:catalase (peroxidase I)